jgi:ATP-dependent Clp protease ATP-binding subunit ClpC
MIVGDIQGELDIPNSTLSHHLEKLRMENLVEARKDKQWLWYSANAQTLQELLGFLYAECCSRGGAWSLLRSLRELRDNSSELRKDAK